MLWTPLLFFACSGKDNTETGDTADATPAEAISSYTTGQYRLSQFIIESDEGIGADWDTDGEVDNNLPQVLSTFDLVLADIALAPDAVNKQIAGDIAKNQLVMLQECTQEDSVLSIDFLGGDYDAKSATFSVDAEASYDSAGNPLSHLEGGFSTESEFEVGPGTLTVPVPLDPKIPPFPFPVEEVQIVGSLTADASAGSVVGVVPVDRFIDEVLIELVPKEGYDLNGNGEIGAGEDRDSIMELVDGLLSLETQADVDLGGGRRGISAAFEYAAVPETW